MVMSGPQERKMLDVAPSADPFTGTEKNENPKARDKFIIENNPPGMKLQVLEK